MRTVIRRLWLASILVAIQVAGFLWRRLMWRTRFIAVTGTLGKTTTKELIAHCLAELGPVVRTEANRNGPWGVPRAILDVRPRHLFAVLETATSGPGQLAELARIVRPDVAVVLLVALEHRSAFRTIDAVAKEKAQLAWSVPPGGVVWLNGDDPRVAAMPVRAGVQKRFFGTQQTFDVWASNVHAGWPNGLSFTAHSGEEEARVSTPLIGAQWLPVALSALAVSVECGLTLDRAAKALASAPLTPGRMQPVQLSTGAIMLRDDFKGSINTFHAALDVLRTAPAGRRWVVASGFDETSRAPSERMLLVAREIRKAADFALFIGDHADIGYQRALREGMPHDHVFQAWTVKEAADIIRLQTRPGDLILLKGPYDDHLARIYFAQEEARFGTVACWKENCKKRIICDLCPELHGRKSALPGAAPRE